MKHTPGPWHWVERHIWAESTDSDICIMTVPIMNANAKLIAKAPEMYQLLKDLEEDVNNLHIGVPNGEVACEDRLNQLLKEIENDS